ncbi:TSUP family transporter [Bartonella sp. LJL80]
MIDFLTDPTIVTLIFAALAAGIIDSIAGGGGLITIPVLMLSGIPPVTALGTNKLQGLFGSFSATLAYARAGHVDLRKQFGQALMAFFGSVVGALVAVVIPVAILQAFLPVLLIVVALYFALKPNLNDIDKTQRIGPMVFCLTMAPLVGFYDGLFGPGAGSFYMLAFVSLAGYGILKATAHTKLLNFSSNVGGFLTFALVGSIDFRIGISMGIAQFIGAQIGARIAMRVGSRLIKPLLVIVCLILAVKLLWDPHNPLREFLHL